MKSTSFPSVAWSKKIFYRAWDSPTITTWGSYAAKSINLIIVLPLLLTHLEAPEIAVWYLFKIIIDFQPLADIGLGVTFSRVIAYAMGGSNDIDRGYAMDSGEANLQTPNWPLIERISSSMNYLFNWVSGVALLVVLVFGTLAFIRPISMVQDQSSAWIAWGVIIGISVINLRFSTYSVYLQGINQIALLRRWETIIGLFSIFSSILVLVMTENNLLLLVLSNQIWILVNIIVNKVLCGRVEEGRYNHFENRKLDAEVFTSVWPRAWRSGLGVFMGYGVAQISGFIFAQVGTAESVASYLLALKLIQVISNIARAPFYSKIPLISRKYAERQWDSVINLARRGMILAYWSFVLGFIFLGLFAGPLLQLINSNAGFVPQDLWALLGLGFFIERFGAMHIQLYSTTNHIIWHIANGISGIIYIVGSLVLFNYIGVYAFPLAYLLSYLLFYAWYSAMHSYRAFELKFWSFEPRVSVLPFLVIFGYSLVAIFV